MITPSTKDLIARITHNEWSDEARRKSAESRKRKSMSGLKKAGILIGGTSLLAGGALLGGVKGMRGAAKLMTKGRLLQKGEDITGKVIGMVDGVAKPSEAFFVKVGKRGSKQNLSKVLRKVAKNGKGWKKRLAQVAVKADDSLAIPAPHYGVGVGPDSVAHVGHGFDPTTESKYMFRRYTGSVGSPIKVFTKSKATPEQLAERLQKAGGSWSKRSTVCEGKNCEMFAREIAEGKKGVSKFRRAATAGLTGGALAGSIPGAGVLSMLKEKKNTSSRVQNMLQVINGGPGSGNHGHKGIPGHQGGSMPKGEGSPYAGARYQPARIPLSESKEDRDRREQRTFTKTSKLADLFSERADELQKSKRSIPRKQRLEELYRAHAHAAKTLEEAANQVTLLKGAGKDTQIQRLRKAAEHRRLAIKYWSKQDKKARSKKFFKGLGGAFVEGAGLTPKHLAAKAGAVASREAIGYGREAIKGGYKGFKETKGKEYTTTRDMSMPESEAKAAESLFRRHGRQVGEDPGPMPKSMKDLMGARKVASETKKASVKDILSAIGKEAGSSAKDRARSQRDRFMSDEIDKIMADKEAVEREFGRFQDLLDAEKKFTRFKKTGGSKDSSKAAEVYELDPDRPVIPPFEGNSADPNGYTEITANISVGVRRESLGEREYLVAPLTMIVPGVLPGNKGPLLYPEEEVSKNPTAWNNVPIVVNHPMKDGIPVEARSPDILEKYQIGTVFNAKYNGKLVAEGWFDIDRTRKTNVGIYQQLINNKPIELSTGLYTDNQPFRGTWNGRDYHYIARNYRPDHLAILLTSKGACSIKDGCGVLINKKHDVVDKVERFKQINNQLLVDEINQMLINFNPLRFGAAGMVDRAAKKKFGKERVQGAKTGFKGGLAGAVVGGAAGTAVGGPVGALVGGSAGAAIGGRIGVSRARKKFGAQGAQGAELGSSVGSLAAPMGKAGLAFAPKKLAKGSGLAAKTRRFGSYTKQVAKQTGVGGAAYIGTDAAIGSLGKKKRQPVQNAWTEEARKKSIEARRRRSQANMDTAKTAGVATGAGIAGYTGARIIAGQANKAIESEDIKRAIRKSKGLFGDLFRKAQFGVDPVTRDRIVQLKKAGVGRRAAKGVTNLGPKVLKLLKRIRVR